MITETPAIAANAGKDGLKTLKPENIESISVLKDHSAIELYGEEAKNGVVIITTKESRKKDK